MKWLMCYSCEENKAFQTEILLDINKAHKSLAWILNYKKKKKKQFKYLLVKSDKIQIFQLRITQKNLNERAVNTRGYGSHCAVYFFFLWYFYCAVQTLECTVERNAHNFMRLRKCDLNQSIGLFYSRQEQLSSTKRTRIFIYQIVY